MLVEAFSLTMVLSTSRTKKIVQKLTWADFARKNGTGSRKCTISGKERESTALTTS